ncbi:MAG: argininosuccinate lyase [Chloroflexi bacterium]|nr:argininosuccinate lyase [Chloroflexota bacterium]
MADSQQGAGGATLYSHRFTKAQAAGLKAINDSLPVDRRMYEEDIIGSIAHARMLGRQGIIPAEDARAIVDGLVRLHAELGAAGGVPADADDEDIHTFVERRLGEMIGAAAGRLHTARSRNDQVANDLRMWSRAAICDGTTAALALQAAFIDRAERDRGLILPGYTHVQRGQPVLIAHHWLAYAEMLKRDVSRLEDCLARMDELTLGAGALAGSPYPLDRQYAAGLLGFSRVAGNSMDAVADRDFVVEHLSIMALMAVHLSRLGEELVLWSSAEFGFIEMDDAYSTGSSIMPQKKNADAAELIRGKSGRAVGTLVQLLVTLKGLPMTYNKDMQEDKEGYFRAVDDVQTCLQLAAEMVATLRVRPEGLRAAVSDPLLLATDLADYLTRSGLPFREAHGVVGAIVRDFGASFTRQPASELAKYHALLSDGLPPLTPRTSVQSRDILGGTAPRQVSSAIRRARKEHMLAAARLKKLRAALPSVEGLAALPW